MEKYKWVKALSFIGVLLSIYLLWQQIAQPEFQPCNISETVNCDAVISGPVAKTLGISTPLYGLIGYVVIFIAAHVKKNKLMLGMTTFGLLFCLRLTYIELFQLNVVCPVCISCQVVMIAVFVLAVILNRRKVTIEEYKE